jgi:Arylsulfotransferase (ASST)
MIRSLFFSGFFFFQCTFLFGQTSTDSFHNKDVTILESQKVMEGYTLIAPFTSKKFYLIDHGGYVVKKWESLGLPGAETAILPDGRILRAEKINNPAFPTAGSTGGIVHIYNWDNTINWEYSISSENELQHHDVMQLPNGNFLFSVWEKKTKEMLQKKGKIFEGRESDCKELWVDKIIEVQQTGKSSGKIVWEWKLWDHLIQDKDSTKEGYKSIAANPDKVNINYNFLKQGNASSFSHINGFVYIKELDILILSVRNFDELWFIDHSTTTKEATENSGGRRKKGGRLLYRWGNAFAYQSCTYDQRKLFGQHHPTYIKNLPNHGGNIMVYNNLQIDSNSVECSTISEINIPFNNGNFLPLTSKIALPKDYSWNLKPENFASKNISSAQRLPNGNTLTCVGAGGVVYEFTTRGKLVWKYQLPIHNSSIFKAIRYPKNYSAFKKITLKRTVELLK